jgi:dipeptidyl aminopeptidase/acylaminoacyl peptidase
MPDLSERLERELEEVPVRQAAPREIIARTARRLRHRKIATALMAFVLSLGAFALLFRAFGPTTVPAGEPTVPADGLESASPSRGIDGPTALVERIVFNTLAWPNLPGQLYTVGPDGSGLTKITTDDADYSLPAVSPDGTMIAFDRFAVGSESTARHEGIYTTQTDGSNMHEVFATDDTHPIAVHELAWSPDGSRIGFIQWVTNDSDAELWMVGADGSDPHRLVD